MVMLFAFLYVVTMDYLRPSPPVIASTGVEIPFVSIHSCFGCFQKLVHADFTMTMAMTGGNEVPMGFDGSYGLC